MAQAPDTSPLGKRYILDSSALAVYMNGVAGHDEVLRILVAARAKRTAAYLTMFSLAEFLSEEERGGGVDRSRAAWAKVQQLPIKFVDIDRALALAGAHIKARYSLKGGDPFAAALAERQQGILVTSNADYRKLDGLVMIEWLPRGASRETSPQKTQST